VPGLEVEYLKFLEQVQEETCDPEWNIQNHPARATLDRFSPLFGQWVAWLKELLWLHQADYPLEINAFSLLDWKSLGILKQWEKSRNQ
jgi:hypothetical protein